MKGSLTRARDPLKSKAKRISRMPSCSERLAHSRLLIFIAIQQHKPAAARAGNLATHRAIFPGNGVHTVNAGIGNLVGDLLFALPSFMEKLAEAMQVAVFQRLAHTFRQIADTMQ